MDSIILHADAKKGLESLNNELTKEKYQTSKEYRKKIFKLRKLIKNQK